MNPSVDTSSLAHSNQLMKALKQDPTQTEASVPTSPSMHPAFKAIVSLLLLGGFLGYRFLYPEPEVFCISDAYQDATQSWNRHFVQDRSESSYEGNSNQLTTTGKAMIGTGQVLMDLWIFILGLVWIIKVKNLRSFFALGLFFLTRGVFFLNIEKFPFPDHMAWRSPGLFSFTVPYDHTRDFFYSGHTGTLTVIFLQMVMLDIKSLAILAFVSLLFMMNLLLITKVHYVIDIAGGLIMAVWYFRLSTRIVIYFDKLLTLPYNGVKWIYDNKCNESEPEEPEPQRIDELKRNEELERPYQSGPELEPETHSNMEKKPKRENN